MRHYKLVARSRRHFLRAVRRHGFGRAVQGYARGRVDLKGKTVVCVLTGHGLKDPDTAIKGMPAPQMIPARIDALLDVIR